MKNITYVDKVFLGFVLFFALALGPAYFAIAQSVDPIPQVDPVVNIDPVIKPIVPTLSAKVSALIASTSLDSVTAIQVSKASDDTDRIIASLDRIEFLLQKIYVQGIH